MRVKQSKDKALSEVFTLKEASRYLKIHTSTLYRLAEQGKAPASKIGKIWRFKKDDINAWLEQSKVNNKATNHQLFPEIPAQDRRRHPRGKIELSIEVKSASDKKVSAKSIDISESGIKLSSEEPKESLGEAMLCLNLPFPPFTAQFPSEAIWSRRQDNSPNFFYGLRFRSLNKEENRNLKKILWLCDSFIDKNIEPLFQRASNVSAEVAKIVEGFFKKEVKNYLNSICNVQSNIYKGTEEECASQATISSLSHEVTKKGAEFELQVDNRIISKESKQTFREMVASWVYESEIMKRGFEKPRGYPGDYKMLELIYDNQEITKGTGKYFDRFFLDNPYAEAVRNRKTKMCDVLHMFFENCKLPLVKILNLASGSCREIKESFKKEFLYKGNVTITCVDHDEEALEYSNKALVSVPSNIKMEFVKANILKFPEQVDYYSHLLGKQNLIYSIGLIDYLPDRILKHLLKFCFTLLAPKGQLIVTHKDRDRDPHAPIPPDWFCDWKFVTRNEEHLVNLVKDSMPKGDFRVRTERDVTGKIVFLFAEKYK